MGQTYTARCVDCGHEFEFDSGGGFSFHLLRCDTCGRPTAIGFDQIAALHVGYLKGLPQQKRLATAIQPRWFEENPEAEPLSSEEYCAAVEEVAGQCSHCEGQYLFDAPPRCPRCHSRTIEEGKVTVHYD